MDRGRCLQVLEHAGMQANAKALHLIHAYWEKSVIVCRVSGYHNSPFSAKCGVAQGSPLSPTVDPIVREWVRLMEAAGINVTNIWVITVVF